MIKKAQYTYRGMNQDLSKSKRSPEYYFEASNIKITATDTDSFGSLTIEKGNDIVFTLSSETRTIIGATDIDKYIVLFLTDDDGYDSIYKVDCSNNYEITNLISGDLNFNSSNYIEAIGNYEHEELIKVYWVDGINQYRFINIMKPTKNIALLDVVPPYKISSPRIESIDRGGLHTAGKIQYAYNLLIKNGQQTTISPFSQLTPLAYDNKGGKVNEIVGQINNVIIDSVDTDYDIIRLYAIKYTSYNQSPQVSLIAEESITSPTFRYSDDGNKIYDISLDELLFLGGTPITPFTLESKKNVLLLGNIKEKYFDINLGLNPGDEGYYDTRAFRFPKLNTETQIKNSNQEYQTVKKDSEEGIVVNNLNTGVYEKPEKTHDCINTYFEEQVETTETDVTQHSQYTISSLELNDVITHSVNPYEGNYYMYTISDLPNSLPEHAYEISVRFIGLTAGEIGQTILSFTSEQALDFKNSLVNKLNNNIYLTANGAGEFKALTDYDGKILLYFLKNTGELDELSLGLPNMTVYETSVVSTTTGSDACVYKYSSDLYGATGDNIELSLVKDSTIGNEVLLKAGEIYRIGIEFYNKYGQFSQPHWVVDLKVPDNVNLNNDYISLVANIKNTDILVDQNVVGYRLLRVERTDGNKTRLDQGIVSSGVYQLYDDNSLYDLRTDNPDALAYGDKNIIHSWLNSDNKREENIEVPFYAPGVNVLDKTKGGNRNAIDESIKNNSTILPSPFIRNKNDIIDCYYSNKPVKIKYPEGENPDLLYNSSVDENTDDEIFCKRGVRINKLNNNHLLNDNSTRFLKDNNNKTILGPPGSWLVWGEEAAKAELDGSRVQPIGEVFSTRESNDLRSTNLSYYRGTSNMSLTVQNNELIQLYSPESTILNKGNLGVNKFKIKAYLNQSLDNCSVRGRKYSTDTREVIEDLQLNKVLSLFDVDTRHGLDLVSPSWFKDFLEDIFSWIKGSEKPKNPLRTFFHENGLIGPTGDSETYIEYQYRRPYEFLKYTSENYSFLDPEPLFVGKGEKNKFYTPEYKFDNHLGGFIADKNARDDSRIFDGLDNSSYGNSLLGIQSIGNNCYIFVEENKTPLEDIVSEGEAVLAEFNRTLPNQYGGNTYEARSKNAYLRIGDYMPIDQTKGITEYSHRIKNAGDIYSNIFRFQRIVPGISKVYSSRFTSICEIVEVPIESSINLKYRDDLSTQGWNVDFHPQHEDYHSYNRVYSQEPVATKNTANPFTFDPISYFNNKITASKIKTAGELVDSWTDVLINEELLLNGKYGELTKLITHNDTILAFQETGIATLQVQPRIQQVTTDGKGVELGTGQILYNYNYLTTDSGSTNRRAVFKSPAAIYYLDSINKSINRIAEGLEGLTTQHGLQVFMNNNIKDSYYKSQNIHGIYDSINNDAYFIFDSDFCLRFNEQIDAFTDFISLEESNIMFNSKYGLFSSNNTNNVYKHYIGDRATFYGTTYNSYIDLLFNPSLYFESVFNNINFKAELYNASGEDVYTQDGVNFTLPIKSMHLRNEYQKSNITPLVYDTNIMRKFRDWSVELPRDKNNVLDRIRGNWSKLKLNIDNTNNYKLILHDVILSYTEIQTRR